MRRISKKRQERLQLVEPLRDDYRCQFPVCQVPECSRLASDIHEISRGASRGASLGERCTWLHLCRPCHEEMGDYSKWPIVRQLAVKKLADPEGYDLAAFCVIRGRAEGAINEDEVNGLCVEFTEESGGA